MNSETPDKHIRVPERVHYRIRALKRDDETMGETVDRLIGGYTLVDFAAETKSVSDDTARNDLGEAYNEYIEKLERTMVSDDT